MFMEGKAQRTPRGGGIHIREAPADRAGKAAVQAASRPVWPCPAAVSSRRVSVCSVSLIGADRIPGPTALHGPTVGPLSQSSFSR